MRAEKLFTAVDRRFGGDGRFDIVRCVACRLVRTEPQPEDLAPYYPGGYYSYGTPMISRLTRAIIARTYGKSSWLPLHLRLLQPLAKARLAGLPPGPPGRLLDVGSGSGAFLLGLIQAGWTCDGLDVDERAVSAAKAAGLEGVRRGDLLDAGLPAGGYDAIRFMHSLEHLRSPRAALQEARRLLRPGGSVTIGVPNFGSLLARAARSRWFYLDVPRHLWHFDERTLRRMVQESGFVVRRVRYASYSSAIIGTLGYVFGWDESAVWNRPAWFALQPLAVALDAVRLGDDLEVVAELPA